MRFTHLSAFVLLASTLLLAACDDDAVAPEPDPGYGWSKIPGLPSPAPIIRGLASTGSGLVAVGDGGMAALGGPEQWQFADANAPLRFNSAWESPGGELFAVGSDEIVRYSDGMWVTEDSLDIEYHDIAGNSTHVFAVGNDGTIKRRETDWWLSMGVVWPTGVVHDLLAISVNESEGFISGNGGTVLHFNGSHWEPMQTHSGETLWDIIAVEDRPFRAMTAGSAGTILQLSTDTGEWTKMTTPVVTSLHAIVIGPSGNVRAAGAHGVMLGYLENQWVSLPSPTSSYIVGFCVHDGALYACGGDVDRGGLLFRYGPHDP
jgi:hypothetical protein